MLPEQKDEGAKFKNLPEHIKQKALSHVKEFYPAIYYRHYPTFQGLSEVRLEKLFVWFATKEGHIYWKNVDRMYTEIEGAQLN